MAVTQRRYDWKPDVPDHRDHYFALHAAATGLPDHVDPLGTANPMEDQGNLGSCTGNASTSALEMVTAAPPLSRLMAYYDARAIEGTVKYDDGAMIRDVIKGFMSAGCCNESLWPYDITKFAKRPTAKAYSQAKQIIPKVSSYQRVTSLDQVKIALSAGRPVIFGFMVPAYFESAEVETNGWVRMPTLQDQMIGGHAVLAVGYDNRPTASPKPFIWVRNSWGKNWGITPPNNPSVGRGYFKMDQAWFSDPRRLVDDMWVIHPK